ncbi:MAG: peptidylprolyl isomerase [Bacteroidales bacterium]
MATLQKIRNRSGLVVTVLAIALFGFIVTDYFSRSNSGQARSSVIATVGDEEIGINDFNKLKDISEVMFNNQQRSSEDLVRLNTSLIQQLITGAKYQPSIDALDLGVSNEEMKELTSAENASPVFAQSGICVDQRTRQFDPNMYMQFNRALHSSQVQGEQRANLEGMWNFLEYNIKYFRKMDKFHALVSKGLYTTSNESLNEANALNSTIDFEAVVVPFDKVASGSFDYTKSDLQAYYDKYKDRYKSEENCRISYMDIPIEASAADIESTRKWTEDRMQGFSNTKNVLAFISTNSDVKESPAYYTEATIDEELKDTFATSQQYDVYGPFVEDDRTWIARVDTVGMLPDSVRISQIVINVSAEPTQTEIDSLYKLTDSIKTMLDNGANFSKMVEQYSTNPITDSKGGDMGWITRANPMSNIAFSLNKGESAITTSQSSFHIIRTTDIRTRSRQALISKVVRYIEPGTDTKQAVYENARRSLANISSPEDISKTATELQAKSYTETVVRSARSLSNINDSKSVIDAAFNTKNGLVSNFNKSSILETNNNSLIIAYVDRYAESGYTPLSNVEEQIIPEVIKEKKAELLTTKLNEALSNNSDFKSVATTIGGTVESVTGVNFSAGRAGKLGNEPALLGAAYALDINATSKPIVGNNGVYVIKVTDKRDNQSAENINLDAQKSILNTTLQMTISNSILSDLNNKYEVKDESYLFF